MNPNPDETSPSIGLWLPWYLDTCNLTEVIVKDSRGNTVHYEDLGSIPSEWQSFRREEAIREAHAAAQAMVKWSETSPASGRQQSKSLEEIAVEVAEPQMTHFANWYALHGIPLGIGRENARLIYDSARGLLCPDCACEPIGKPGSECPACGKVFELQEQESAEVNRLRCKLEEANKYQAVCHCGELLSNHYVFSSCTAPKEMPESCPYAEDLRALQAATAESVSFWLRMLDRMKHGCFQADCLKHGGWNPNDIERVDAARQQERSQR